MSYVFECIDTDMIAEANSGSGITLQNDVNIINASTLTTNGIVDITNTTPAGTGTGALIVDGGVSFASALGLAGEGLNMNGAHIRNGPTNLSSFNDDDYITKAAAQELSTGLNVLQSSTIATIAPIASFVTPTTGGNVITAIANGNINDDVNGGTSGNNLFDVPTNTLVDTGPNPDVILVKNDNNGAPDPPLNNLINGIYTITDVGSGSTPWVLTRIAELDSGDNAFQAYTFVSEGDTQSGGYIQTFANPTTVGTDELAWSLFINPTAQTLEQVLGTGNTTGNNNIVIDTGSNGILSTAGTNLNVNAGTDDLVLSGDNVLVNATTNLTTTVGGNVLENITGTSTVNAAGITLDSSAAFTASGTTASLTADTGDLALTSTAGDTNISGTTGINLAADAGGVSIDTGTNTITVNSGDVAITAPLPQDVVGAINALQTSVLANVKQRVSYSLANIPIRTKDAFPTIKQIYWTWFGDRYGDGANGMDYGNPVLVYEVVENSVDVHVRNQTAGNDLLATVSRGVGFYADALTDNPLPNTNNAEIFVEFRSTSSGDRARVRGVAIEFIANKNPAN